MAGKGEWERLWLVNKLLSVWKATVNMLGEVSAKTWNSVLGWGTYTQKCQSINMERAEQWQFVYLTEQHSGQVGGTCWHVLVAEGDAGGVRMQRVSLHLWAHLQLVVSSGLWCFSMPRAALSILGSVPCFVRGWGEPGLSWQRPHEEHLAVLCPGFAVAQQCWQVKIALLLNMLQWGNPKENSCLKQYEKKLFRDLNNRKMQVSSPSVEATVWLHLLQCDLTNRNFVLDV